MFCIRCGEELIDESQFCHSCGKEVCLRQDNSTNFEKTDNQVVAGMSPDEFSKKVIIALYTKPGFPKALKDLDDAARQTGFRGEKCNDLQMLFFSIFVEELHGLSPLEQLGIDEIAILPEIKEEETNYRNGFLHMMLHDEELWPISKLSKLNEVNIRHAFRDIKNQTDVEKLISKINKAKTNSAT